MVNAMNEHVLLVEIGTEELPPKDLKHLSEAFATEIEKGFNAVELRPSGKQVYATPRRLAVIIQGLPKKQPDRNVERKGPSLIAAFDEEGNPTKAALGFARSCGVEVDTLEKLQTNKGAWLVHRDVQPGEYTSALAADVVRRALEALPIARRMRWGSADFEFVRPVHWVVLLLDEQVIEDEILGVKSGSSTKGHRFLHPGSLRLSTPSNYPSVLQQTGKVLPDFQQRRAVIQDQVEHCARELHGRALVDDSLLDEVTALVEWPQAIIGSFEERFLDIPPEVLVSTMQDHQKYFPVVNRNDDLLPYFVVVANVDSGDTNRIREGNERVIRPRFSDAEFFWQQDRKQTLADRRQALKSVVFQDKLGSLLDKSARLAELVTFIATELDANASQARRSAELSKCDLLTQMVNEFPSLQGVMGCYYARHDGETEEVAIALDEQYKPRQAGGVLPLTIVGQTLALCDRLDTLVGIFAIGQKPTGVKDPFGLRRASLGVLRILIECELNLDLEKMLDAAAQGFATQLHAERVVPEVFDYVTDRLKAYYLERGIAVDVFEAVQARRPTRPVDFDQRVRAIERFRKLPAAQSLTAANKRIRNILRQGGDNRLEIVDETKLELPAEQELYGCLGTLRDEVGTLYDSGEYEQALNRLSELREPVDRFFDEVMVMVEDELLRSNRMALLNQLSELFLRTGDLSRLQQ